MKNLSPAPFSRPARPLAALALLLAAVGAAQAQTPASFATARYYSTGLGYGSGRSSDTYDVTVADVNGDGRPDIVTAHNGSYSAGVLLNTGTYTPLAAANATADAEAALFPNPAHGDFAVRLPAAWGAAPVRAELLNALGQVVRQQAAALPAGGTLAFATAGLVPGVYVLRVRAGGYALARRVVVE